MTDDAGFASESAVNCQIRALLDERQILLVGSGRPGEVARFLDHDLLGSQLLRELVSEPLSGVHLVEFHVAERIARYFLARRLHLGDDGVQAGSLGKEDGDIAHLIHHFFEALSLGGDIDDRLGHIHGVNVPRLSGQADLGQPFLRVQPLAVIGGGGGSQPSAMASHHLVHDEHPGA